MSIFKKSLLSFAVSAFFAGHLWASTSLSLTVDSGDKVTVDQNTTSSSTDITKTILGTEPSNSHYQYVWLALGITDKDAYTYFTHADVNYDKTTSTHNGLTSQFVTVNGGNLTIAEDVFLNHLSEYTTNNHDEKDRILHLTGDDFGSVVNHGVLSIVGERPVYIDGDNKAFNNFGSIFTTNVAVGIEGGFGNLVVNNGEIQISGQNPIQFNSGNSVVHNLGTISSASSQSISSFNVSRNSITVNDGTISSLSVNVYFSNSGNNMVVNNGILSVEEDSSVYVWNSHNNLFVNKGVVSAGNWRGFYNYASNNVTFINSGNVLSRSSYAVELNSADNNVIHNSGNIFSWADYAVLFNIDTASTAGNNIINTGSIHAERRNVVGFKEVGYYTGHTYQVSHNSLENYGTLSSGVVNAVVHLGRSGYFYTNPVAGNVSRYQNINSISVGVDNDSKGIIGYCIPAGQVYTVGANAVVIRNTGGAVIALNHYHNDTLGIAGDGKAIVNAGSTAYNKYDVSHLRGTLELNQASFDGTVSSKLGGSAAIIHNRGTVAADANLSFGDGSSSDHPGGADRIAIINSGTINADLTNVQYYYHGNGASYGGASIQGISSSETKSIIAARTVPANTVSIPFTTGSVDDYVVNLVTDQYAASLFVKDWSITDGDGTTVAGPFSGYGSNAQYSQAVSLSPNTAYNFVPTALNSSYYAIYGWYQTTFQIGYTVISKSIFGVDCTTGGLQTFSNANDYHFSGDAAKLVDFAVDTYGFAGGDNVAISVAPSSGWNGSDAVTKIDLSHFTGTMKVGTGVNNVNGVANGRIRIEDSLWSDITLQTTLSSAQTIDVAAGAELAGINFFDGNNMVILNMTADDKPNVGSVQFITNENHVGPKRAGVLRLVNSTGSFLTVKDDEREWSVSSDNGDNYTTLCTAHHLQTVELKGKFKLGDNFAEESDSLAINQLKLLKGTLDINGKKLTIGSKIVLVGQDAANRAIITDARSGQTEIDISVNQLQMHDHAVVAAGKALKSDSGHLLYVSSANRGISGSQFGAGDSTNAAHVYRGFETLSFLSDSGANVSYVLNSAFSTQPKVVRVGTNATLNIKNFALADKTRLNVYGSITNSLGANIALGTNVDVTLHNYNTSVPAGKHLVAGAGSTASKITFELPMVTPAAPNAHVIDSGHFGAGRKYQNFNTVRLSGSDYQINGELAQNIEVFAGARLKTNGTRDTSATLRVNSAGTLHLAHNVSPANNIHINGGTLEVANAAGYNLISGAGAPNFSFGYGHNRVVMLNATAAGTHINGGLFNTASTGVAAGILSEANTLVFDGSGKYILDSELANANLAIEVAEGVVLDGSTTASGSITGNTLTQHVILRGNTEITGNISLAGGNDTLTITGDNISVSGEIDLGGNDDVIILDGAAAANWFKGSDAGGNTHISKFDSTSGNDGLVLRNGASLQYSEVSAAFATSGGSGEFESLTVGADGSNSATEFTFNNDVTISGRNNANVHFHKIAAHDKGAIVVSNGNTLTVDNGIVDVQSGGVVTVQDGATLALGSDTQMQFGVKNIVEHGKINATAGTVTLPTSGTITVMPMLAEHTGDLSGEYTLIDGEISDISKFVLDFDHPQYEAELVSGSLMLVLEAKYKKADIVKSANQYKAHIYNNVGNVRQRQTMLLSHVQTVKSADRMGMFWFDANGATSLGNSINNSYGKKFSFGCDILNNVHYVVGVSVGYNDNRYDRYAVKASGNEMRADIYGKYLYNNGAYVSGVVGFSKHVDNINKTQIHSTIDDSSAMKLTSYDIASTVRAGKLSTIKGFKTDVYVGASHHYLTNKKGFENSDEISAISIDKSDNHLVTTSLGFNMANDYKLKASKLNVGFGMEYAYTVHNTLSDQIFRLQRNRVRFVKVDSSYDNSVHSVMLRGHAGCSFDNTKLNHEFYVDYEGSLKHLVDDEHKVSCGLKIKL